MGEARIQQWGAPLLSPPLDTQRDYFDDTSSHWRRFDSSVNAVSFGFVATAVLISMFLVMAIFERFLRPEDSPDRRRYRDDVEAGVGFHGKLRFPSPKAPTKSREVSVLMPGDNIPRYLAQPAPVPCAPERISWPTHQNTTQATITQNPIQAQVQTQSVRSEHPTT